MDEEMVLIRRLGRVQARMTQTVQRMVVHINQQDAEIIRLRARLIMSRTCMLWGLQGLPHTDPRQADRPWVGVTGSGEPAPTRSLADQVICQTGCISHAHHWLGEEGQCQRDGEPCGLRIEQGERYVPAA
jgi:hypothetical protein